MEQECGEPRQRVEGKRFRLVGDSRLDKMWNSPLYFPFHCRQFCYENSSKAKVPETSRIGGASEDTNWTQVMQE